MGDLKEISIKGTKRDKEAFIQTYPIDRQSIYLTKENLISLDLSEISEMTDLRKIRISYQAIKSLDLSPLNNCSTIEELEISRSGGLKNLDLKPLSTCKNLKRLNIHGLYLSNPDLTPIRSCLSLESLSLGGQTMGIPSVDLDVLEDHPKLKNIFMENNMIHTIKLTSTPQLEAIILMNNNIEKIDLEPLRGSPCLSLIDLRNNKLTEINLNPLSECYSLETLWLKGNQIENLNISPLFVFSSIKVLDIADNILLNASLKFRKSPLPIAFQEKEDQISWNAQTSLDELRFSISEDDQEKYIDISHTPDDFYEELIQLINQCYWSELIQAVLFFSRKLIENLLIDILRKKFRMSNIELFYKPDENRFQNFNKLLRNFEDKLSDFHPVMPHLDRNFIIKINRFRERGNSSAHNLEFSFSINELNLLRSDLELIVRTLIRLYNNIA